MGHGGAHRVLIAEGLIHFIELSPRAARVPRCSTRPRRTTSGTRSTTPAYEANWQQAHFKIDGGRHGKPDITKQTSYNKPVTNALFCDGHAETVSVRQSWNGIVVPGEDLAKPW